MEDGAAVPFRNSSARMRCPLGGSFWACKDGSKFLGCCVSNPCGTSGCPRPHLLPAQMIASSKQHTDARCASGTFSTCAATSAEQFWGCCEDQGCIANCALADLREASLPDAPDLVELFSALNSTIQSGKLARLDQARAASANGQALNPDNGRGLFPPPMPSSTGGTSAANGSGDGAEAGPANGAIAGIALGVLAAVAILAGLIYWQRHRHLGDKRRIPKSEGRFNIAAFVRRAFCSPFLADSKEGTQVKTEKEQSSHQGIFWRAPAIIIGTLLGGLALALGHHFYYTSLNGQHASDGRVNVAGWDLSRQQITIAAGTALAFLVRSALTVSVSTAYTQVFWFTITRAEYRVSSIDDIFGALHDLLAAMSVFRFWRVPVIPLLVLIGWALPIATIIAPAALTIAFERISDPPSLESVVPLPAFASLSYASWRTAASVPGGDSAIPVSSLQYSGPHQEVIRIANAAAASGAILPIPASRANASWSVAFQGPSLHCKSITDFESMKQNIQEVFAKNVRSNDTAGSCLDAANMFTYLAWQQNASDVARPFEASELQIDNVVMSDLYVAVLPAAAQAIIQNETCVHGQHPFDDYGMSTFFEGATVLQCSFGNSTYDVEFNYTGLTVQNVDVTTTSLNVRLPPPETNLLQAAVTTEDYFALQPLSLNSPTFPLENLTGPVAQIDDHLLRQWSYEAIAAAFKAILLGALNRGSLDSASLLYPSSQQSNDSTVRHYRSPVFSSSLARAKELAALAPGTPTPFGMTARLNTSRGYVQALSMLPQADGSQDPSTLQAVLEELFRNITLSMLSSSSLRLTSESPFKPGLTRVTFNDYTNLYVYNRGRLWLAYGVALGVATICAAIGLGTIYSVGASYTNDFSTVLRATQQARLTTEVFEEDRPGKDPLPASFA